MASHGTFAGLQPLPQALTGAGDAGICVVGTPVRLYESAASQDDLLVPHDADPENKMDRFDCRHMLQDHQDLLQAEQTSSTRSRAVEDSEDPELLDAERYADLDYTHNREGDLPAHPVSPGGLDGACLAAGGARKAAQTRTNVAGCLHACC